MTRIRARLDDEGTLHFELEKEVIHLLTPLFWRKVALSFVRAFIPVFFLGLGGVYDSLATGDWDAGKSALVALAVSAGAAALRAAQALFTTLETPKE